MMLRVETGAELGASGRAPRVRDLVIDLEPEHTVGEVASAIAAHVGVDRRVTLSADRTGSPLDPGITVAVSGLLHGDTVRLLRSGEAAGRPPHRPPHALAADVVTGVDAGTWTVLHPGRYLVGRGPSCDIVLHDPAVERRHAVITVADDWTVEVAPADAVHPLVRVDGHPIDGPVVVGPDDAIGIGDTRVLVRPFRRPDRTSSGRPGQVDFQRTPYRQPTVTDRGAQVIGPVPRRPDLRRFQVLTAIAPLAAGLMLFAFSRQAQFLALTLVSPLVMIANVVEDRRSGRRAQREDVATFRDDVVVRRVELIALRRAELIERRNAAPDLTDLFRRARHRSVDLWARGAGAPDFLHLRVGTGAVDTRFTIEVERGGDETLRHEALDALDDLTRLDEAPIVVDVAGAGVVGIHGPEGMVDGLTSALLLQAACLHSPDDLTIVAAIPVERPMAWLKWLPHLRSITSPVAAPHLARTTADAEALVAGLIEVAAHRADSGATWPHVLAVIDAGAGVDPAELARLLDAGQAVGISVLWTAGQRAEVPHQAAQVIDLAGPSAAGDAFLWSTDTSAPTRIPLVPEAVAAAVAERVARSLAPVRDISTASLASSVPRSVDLTTTIGADVLDPSGVIERWQAPARYGLSFPIGVGAAGAVELDLVEDGPHALVAGTSGAGKSELLQAMVASLASRYPADRLNFLFVDYKGGASSNVFGALPHTVGYVTNLGAGLAMRALTSLRAELNHRMTLLEGRAKDLAEMLEVAPDEAPPSLVIVVDEFATLVKEIPEFVAGIVDIAQRGRSLGIHLVLATQRPSGAVNENILANTNLRICLRMLDRGDSTAVLGAPDAADIPVPLRGRAVARLGAQQLIPFQCAYGGAPVGSESATRPVLVDDFASPEDTPLGRPSRGVTDPGLTQLAAVVDAIARANQQLGIPTPRRPWCEALPEVVVLDTCLRDPRIDEARRHPGRLVSVGLLDAPERQEQRPLLVDLEDGGGCLVFGSGGSGKTTLLRSIAASIQRTSAPGEVVVLGFDFASRGIAALRGLGIVHDVATADDPEAVTRHIVVLERELERRRMLLGAANAEHLTGYNERHSPLPRIVVLIDGFGGIVDTFGEQVGFGSHAGDAWADRLVKIIVDGRQVGVHAVITADRRNAVPTKLHAAIANRLVLRHADESAYADHGIPAAAVRGLDLPPGRALWRGTTTVQLASVSTDPSAHAQSEALARLGGSTASETPACLRSERLPDAIEAAELAVRGNVVECGRHRAPFGVVDVAGDAAVLDISGSHAVVVGPPRSGRSTALATIADALERDHDVYRMGPASCGLARHRGRRSAFGRTDVAELLERLDNIHAMGDPVRPVVVVIDDLEGIDDPMLAPLWERLGERDALRIVAATESRTFSGFTTSALLTRLKRTRRLLVLQPDDPTEFLQLTGRKMPYRPGVTSVPGRGVLLTDRAAVTVQVAVPRGEGDRQPDVRGGSVSGASAPPLVAVGAS
jgi:DNA segregation ATPase FtsK/SpoIIIE, S-DNA-T family